MRVIPTTTYKGPLCPGLKMYKAGEVIQRIRRIALRKSPVSKLTPKKKLETGDQGDLASCKLL